MRISITLSLIALGLTACANSGTALKKETLGNTQVLATTADLRLAFARPKGAAAPGAGGTSSTGAATSYDPNYNVCAEPSPDVAKAISDALATSAQATADGLKAFGNTGASATIGGTLSGTQNAALVELGRRLTTTQTLRDGLYHLCEAYANGGITRDDYALVLSRYGDTMVTMLAIEAVSGIASGQTPATASSTATAPLPAKDSGGAGGKDAGGGAGGGAGAGAGAGGATAAPAGGTPASLSPQEAHPKSGFAANMRPIAYLLPVANTAADTPAAGAQTQATPTLGEAPPPAREKVAAVDAIVKLQQAYLDQSKAAPMVVLCASVLGPDGIKANIDGSELGKSCQEMMRAVGAQAAQVLASRMAGPQAAAGAPDAEKQPSAAAHGASPAPAAKQNRAQRK